MRTSKTALERLIDTVTSGGHIVGSWIRHSADNVATVVKIDNSSLKSIGVDLSDRVETESQHDYWPNRRIPVQNRSTRNKIDRLSEMPDLHERSRLEVLWQAEAAVLDLDEIVHLNCVSSARMKWADHE